MLRTSLFLAACLALVPSPAAAQYRGMTVGWPQQAGGNYAAYYPGNPAGQPAYYVARPNYAAGYAPAGYAPAGYATYMPVTAAYANPGYAAAYGAAPTYAQRPVVAAYYAPAPASYAALNSYRITPAGGSSAGAEAYAGYGQPTTVNYVPPRFAYRTTYAPVPVYMYRPVTMYQPVTGQPVTCLQPTTTTGCQAQRQRWFSHSWFSWFRKQPCGSAPAPAPTTSYCTSGYCPTPCGQQPYYPAQPYSTQPGVIIPAAPAPGTTTPGVWIPAGPTVPPPGTRFPTGGALAPADVAPSLNPRPGGTIVVPPSTPSGSAAPRNPLPGTPSFPVDPPAGGLPSGSGFGGSGAFPSGSNYAPASDPYSNSSRTSPAVVKQPASGGSTLSPGIQPVPDPAAGQQPRPVNRAPQLLDPRDKTATPGDQRWAVVPAVWPAKPRPTGSQPAEQSPYRVYQERSLSAPTANPADYDEGGWTSK